MSTRSTTATRLTRGVVLARGYALFQLLVAIYLVYLAVTSGWATIQMAKLSGGLPADNAVSVGQRSVLVLGVAFQALIALIVFAAGITTLFLASGMWRYREWARHGTLVLAIVSVPILALAPALNWIIATAAASSDPSLQLFPIPAAVIGVLVCIVTVYLFAYHAEVIALYLPRPNLVRGQGNKYVYAPTPLPAAKPFTKKR